MDAKRVRLDVLLVQRGWFSSRSQARAAILAGQVRVDQQVVTKAGSIVPADACIMVVGPDHPYVSRGGVKLEHALRVFGLEDALAGAVCADIGASTGGFTDCLLQHGARRVYAIDVGYGQLAWRLRTDPRVVVMERTNARYLQGHHLPEPVDVVTIDVSFISLRHILPAAVRISQGGGAVISLIKPQFEAGPRDVGKKGVVRDAAVHRRVLAEVTAAADRCGLELLGLTGSPVRGAEGNREFLALWRVPGHGSGSIAARLRDRAPLQGEERRRHLQRVVAEEGEIGSGAGIHPGTLEPQGTHPEGESQGDVKERGR